MSLTTMCCGNCGIEFAVPDHFYNECQEKGADKTWYCPNGHPRIFRESASDKMRRERDQARQQIARIEQERDEAVRREITARVEAKRAELARKRIETRAKAAHGARRGRRIDRH